MLDETTIQTIPDIVRDLAMDVARPSQEIGERPRVEWHSVDCLRIDRRFQRELSDRSARLIRRIVERFEWRLFGIIVVTDNGDGTYSVIDGQHRAIAAALHPRVPAVPIFISDAETLKEQASAFIEINRARLPMNALQFFKARRLAGDEDAVAIHGICTKCRIDVPGNVVGWANLKPRQVLCVRTLNNIYKQHGAAHLERTLRILASAYPDSPGDILAQPVRAASDLLAAYEVRDRDLIEVVSSRAGDEWKDAAMAGGKAGGTSSTAALVQLWVERLKARRIGS